MVVVASKVEIVHEMKKKKKKMTQDLVLCLSSEVIIDILSRLPVQTILSCKCVCKWLRDLIATREFVDFHISNSVPGFAVSMFPSLEMDKTIELRNHSLPDLHLSTITTLNFHYSRTTIQGPVSIMGSVDGLLLLKILKYGNNSCLYLCNPITRELIHLQYHIRPLARQYDSYGFGVSKISGHYKAVRIWVDEETHESDCMVYTVGTGSWRSIGPVNFKYSNKRGMFVNGNLHWEVEDLCNKALLISCFDLETEVFTTFPISGVIPDDKVHMSSVVLVAAEDTLSLCHCGFGGKISVWVMKEYGVDKSWVKEFVITEVDTSSAYPFKVSKDGVIFMACERGNSTKNMFFFYSSKNNTTQIIYRPFESRWTVSSLPLTPSFLSLKSFGMENTFSF